MKSCILRNTWHFLSHRNAVRLYEFGQRGNLRLGKSRYPVEATTTCTRSLQHSPLFRVDPVAARRTSNKLISEANPSTRPWLCSCIQLPLPSDRTVYTHSVNRPSQKYDRTLSVVENDKRKEKDGWNQSTVWRNLQLLGLVICGGVVYIVKFKTSPSYCESERKMRLKQSWSGLAQKKGRFHCKKPSLRHRNFVKGSRYAMYN